MTQSLPPIGDISRKFVVMRERQPAGDTARIPPRGLRNVLISLTIIAIDKLDVICNDIHDRMFFDNLIGVHDTATSTIRGVYHGE